MESTGVVRMCYLRRPECAAGILPKGEEQLPISASLRRLLRLKCVRLGQHPAASLQPPRGGRVISPDVPAQTQTTL